MRFNLSQQLRCLGKRLVGWCLRAKIRTGLGHHKQTNRRDERLHSEPTSPEYLGWSVNKYRYRWHPVGTYKQQRGNTNRRSDLITFYQIWPTVCASSLPITGVPEKLGSFLDGDASSSDRGFSSCPYSVQKIAGIVSQLIQSSFLLSSDTLIINQAILLFSVYLT